MNEKEGDNKIIAVPKDEEYAKEVTRAKKIKNEANKVVTKILKDIKLGKEVVTDKIMPVVDDMVSSSLRNPDALLSLARLKSYDNYTFTHSVNVSIIAVTLGRFLGFDNEKLNNLGLGGMLHDIGKMLIPDEILNKPASLTEDEFKIMRQHVDRGFDFLSKQGGINSESMSFVYEHHERMDGKGYPFGLVSGKISLFGQVGSIVDVYDALTTKRVYHNQMPYSECLKMLYEWAGAQFNKNFVEVFIKGIGLYPVGSLVSLNNNRLAIVWKVNRNNLLRPTVIVMYDLKEEHYLKPKKLNLSMSDNEAIKIIAPENPLSRNIKVEDYL